MMGGGGFDYANMAPSGSSGDGTCLLAPGTSYVFSKMFFGVALFLIRCNPSGRDLKD